MKCLTSVLLLFLFSSCSKTPKAVFTIEDQLYVFPRQFCYTGQTIRMSNTSEDAENYKWEFPDGSVSYEKNPSYRISESSRARTESITLTVSNRRKEKAHSISHDYVLFIANQTTDFYSVDTFMRKALLKFIFSSPSLCSIRFVESGNPDWGRAVEGRVLFKGSFPQPGEYLIANGSVSVEVTTQGYYSSFPYTSKASLGGSVKFGLTPDNKLRMTYDKVRVSNVSSTKEILTSADLVY